MVVIVGGVANTRELRQTIYFAVSNDLRDNKIENIWQQSNITLPYGLYHGSCIITHKSTNNPKLIILGGARKRKSEYSLTKTYLEYDLLDILGLDTFKRFMMDFHKVTDTTFKSFYFCV